MALVACSALSALSLAARGLVNVRRDHHLVGPISLYHCDIQSPCDPVDPIARKEVATRGLRVVKGALVVPNRLDAWLRTEALANNTDHVPTKRSCQYGPNRVRDSRDLCAALAIVAERGRARMEKDGRRRAVAINPALLLDRA